MKKLFKYIKAVHYFSVGKQLLNNSMYKNGKELNKMEYLKSPNRTTVINYLISVLNRETTYLEIGVRNPNDNYNKITAEEKYSVDPGIEYKENPVDFKLTSDAFFNALKKGEILNRTIKFDLIFIDGLHLAEQVERDINNALEFIKDDGFLVLHDCNPPSEWHARETFNYFFSPAGEYWNGTTWKAFLKQRYNSRLQSCCIDSDWGVGILSKTWQLGNHIKSTNKFYEYSSLEKDRKTLLNLIDFEELQNLLKSKSNAI